MWPEELLYRIYIYMRVHRLTFTLRYHGSLETKRLSRCKDDDDDDVEKGGTRDSKEERRSRKARGSILVRDYFEEGL